MFEPPTFLRLPNLSVGLGTFTFETPFSLHSLLATTFVTFEGIAKLR